MPLKPRSRVLADPDTSAPVTSRERPAAGPTPDELVARANAIDTSTDEDVDAGLDTPPTDITDDGDEATDTNAGAVGADPGIEVGGTSHEPDSGVGSGNTANAPTTRRGRPPRATTPTTEPGADPKPRMSEIQREVKALRSEYTAAVKQIEAEYGERLRALRSEYDLLNNQVVEQTFTL